MKKLSKEEIKELRKGSLVSFKYYYIGQIDFDTLEELEPEPEELYQYCTVLYNDRNRGLLYLKCNGEVRVVDCEYADIYR